MSRVRAAVPLLNQHPVPAGVHHDVDRPIPVTVTLRWATGVEVLDTVALEWTRTMVRVRIADLRVMTGAVWLPAEDLRRQGTELDAESSAPTPPLAQPQLARSRRSGLPPAKFSRYRRGIGAVMFTFRSPALVRCLSN